MQRAYNNTLKSKRGQLILNLILLYIIYIFYYGIIIKLTIGNKLLFEIKTYVSEIILMIIIFTTIVKEAGYRKVTINKYSFLLAIMFLLLFVLNLLNYNDVNQIFYCIRDVILPVMISIVIRDAHINPREINLFYKKLCIFCCIYIMIGVGLSIIQYLNGWEWTSKFFTGYSFYGQDSYSKVKIATAPISLRVPGLTGNYTTFSFYCVFSYIVISSISISKKVKQFSQVLFGCFAIIAVYLSTNKTALICLIVLIAYEVLKGWTKFGKKIFSLMLVLLGTYILLNLESLLNRFVSITARFNNLKTTLDVVNFRNLIIPLNFFNYSDGTTDFSSVWDNAYIYFLFSCGIFCTFALILYIYQTLKGISRESQYYIFVEKITLFIMVAALTTNLTQGRGFFNLYMIFIAICHSEVINTDRLKNCDSNPTE